MRHFHIATDHAGYPNFLQESSTNLFNLSQVIGPCHSILDHAVYHTMATRPIHIYHELPFGFPSIQHYCWTVSSTPLSSMSSAIFISHIISLTSQSKHETQCKSTSIRYIVCENLLHFLPIIFDILFRYFPVLVLIYLQFIVQCIVSSSLFDMIFI